jgi:hypothetical protein
MTESARPMTQTEQMKDAAKRLSHACNFGGDALAFSDVVRDEHRTLQQRIVGVMLTTLVGMAFDADRGFVDPRNEAAMRLAQMVRDALVADERTLILNNGEVKLPHI